MGRYRSRVIEVEAWQIDSDEPMPRWLAQCGEGLVRRIATVGRPGSETWRINCGGFRGWRAAIHGDWIVKGPDGLFPLTNERFHQLYERHTPDPA